MKICIEKNRELEVKKDIPLIRQVLGGGLAGILVKPDPAWGWALTDYDYPVLWDV